MLIAGPLAVLCGQSPAAGGVDVPGWVPADGVNPAIVVTTRRDGGTKLWTYTYRVTNRRSATQALVKLVLVLDGAVVSARAPGGWWAAAYNPPAALPGVTFAVERAEDGSWPGAAAPGGPALVFVVVSRYGPGSVRYYARGNVPPLAVDGLEPSARERLPDERRDAVRGATIGPVR
jgi:hypothetical protein